MTTVKEIMRHQTITLAPTDTITFAAERMKEHDIGVFVVAFEGEIAGIITDRDIVVRCIARGLDPYATRVEDIMTTTVVHCMEDDSVDGVAKKLADEHVHRLPVLNHHMELIGLVSIRNLCKVDCEAGGKAVSKIRSM